jgi:hypothetical protein
MGRACGTNGSEKECKQSFGGKSEGKSSLGRQRRRWEIILTQILEKGFIVAWSGLIWLRIGVSGGLL